MPLLDGPSLGGNARHVLRQYAEESALARGRAANAAGTEEFGGGCLRGRYNNLREVIQNNPSLVVVPSIINAGSLFVQRPICRTNYLPNNSMAGATGGVLPTNWSIASLPAGITVSYSASGTAVAADGTSVNYIDVTVSGTAGASGFLNIRPNPSPSTIAAFVGQSWNTSVYLQLISGSVSGISPTWQLQELNLSNTFLQGSNITGLGSLVVGGQFDRYNVSRILTDSATAFVTCRWGHSFVSGTTYSYTLRIGSPQLERFSVATPMIATSTGAVTRLNESTNVVGLPPDFTVSRNTGATRVGPNGLIEAGNTNLALQSEAWNVSPWVATSGVQGATVSGNVTTSPDSTTNADKLIESAVSGNHFCFQSLTLTSGTTYTASFFVKASERTRGRLRMTGSAAYWDVDFNLTSATVTGGTNSFIQNYGNGWYRIGATFTANQASNTFIVSLFDASGNNSYMGDGTSGFFVWGAQVEVGSTASEYIPTTTVARTRFAGVTVDGTIAANIPRIDWLGQSCPGLLVEASGSNLALQSENFGTTWSPNQLIAFGSGSVLNTTGTLDPYGTNVSDLIVASTVSGVQHRIDQTTTSASGSYTFSVFVKAAGYNFTWLRIGTVGAFFNLSNGAITGTSAGIVASSQNYGNGWYRCIISKASSSANEVLRINIIQTDGVTDFAGDGTSGIYVFGAQYETGSVATTYIPTTVAAVSRAADVISASGALVSGLIGQTEGTIYVEVDIRNLTTADFVRIVSLATTANSNNFFEVEKRSSTQLRITARLNSGTSIVFLTHPNAFLLGTNKIAFAYKDGNYAMALNGVVTTSSQSGMTSSLNSVTLGATSANAAQLNDRIRAAALYTTRLSNDQLAELTRL